MIIYSIDGAIDNGRLSRFVNDAPHKIANASTKLLVVNNVPHIALFATKQLEAGDELRYDYGGGELPWRSRNRTPSSEDQRVQFQNENLEKKKSRKCCNPNENFQEENDKENANDDKIENQKEIDNDEVSQNEEKIGNNEIENEEIVNNEPKSIIEHNSDNISVKEQNNKPRTNNNDLDQSIDLFDSDEEVVKSDNISGCTGLQFILHNYATDDSEVSMSPVHSSNISRLENERNAQDKALANIGKYRFKIPEDGNCLFRAVGSQLPTGQEGHLNLRKEACKWLQDHTLKLGDDYSITDEDAATDWCKEGKLGILKIYS